MFDIIKHLWIKGAINHEIFKKRVPDSEKHNDWPCVKG